MSTRNRRPGLSWLLMGVYSVWELLLVFLVLAAGDEPAHPLLALYADLLAIPLMFWAVQRLHHSEHHRTRYVLQGLGGTGALLVAGLALWLYLIGGVLVGEHYTPENVQEVKTLVLLVFGIQAVKLLFLAWSALQRLGNAAKSPQGG